MNRKQWEEAIAEALGSIRSRGLQFVDPSDLPSVRRNDGLSVAAGVAAEWYGLPEARGAWQMTDDEWASLGRPSELDPEWLRAGAGEWLGHVLCRKDAPDDLPARLSRLRPDLVSMVPESAWLRVNDYGEPFVSRYLRREGAVAVVPEPVLSWYVSWVAESGYLRPNAFSLANLSHERPDLVSQVPESVWLMTNYAGEPLVSQYLRDGGVAGVVPETVWLMTNYAGEPIVSEYVRKGGDAGCVPESVWAGYVLWVASTSGESWRKADSLARLLSGRPDLVALVPESVWLLEDADGEPFVSKYLREGGVSGVVPEPVWLRYVSWVAGKRCEPRKKSRILAYLSHERPDLLVNVPESVWMLKGHHGEPIVSRYLRAGGAAGVVPETAWPRYVSWVAGKRDSILLDKALSLARLSNERPDIVVQVPESVWMREDRSGEPLVSKYLRREGAVAVVPEPVWARYLSWVLGGRGDDGYKTSSLAKLSHERPDLVAKVPESVWMLKGYYGEPIVSTYLRHGGVAGSVTETVWDGYVSWVVGERDSILFDKALSLSRLSLERPDIVARVPNSVWLKECLGEPLVSRYLRVGGAVTALPEHARSIGE